MRGEFEIVIFNPRLDGDFFDEDFATAVRNPAARKPSMIGFNTHESGFLSKCFHFP